MNKNFLKAIFMLIALIPALAFGALTSTDRALILPYNLLENPGFENGKGAWVASGGTFAIVTTGSNLGVGKASATWDSSGASQTLSSSAMAVPEIYKGAAGQAYCRIKTPSGSATHKIQIYDGSSVLAEENVISSTSYAKTPSVIFTFPSSGSIRLRLSSVNANEPLIAIDECIVKVGDADAAGVWSFNGNTVGSEKWIGTSDNFGITFKTNNATRFTVAAAGTTTFVKPIIIDGGADEDQLVVEANATQTDDEFVKFKNSAGADLYTFNRAGLLKTYRAAAPPGIYANRANTSISTGSRTIVADGDALGTFQAFGFDGTNYSSAGYVQYLVDGTPGANDMPGRFQVFTSPDGTASPTEKMRITNNGVVVLGSGAPTAGTSLDIKSTTGAVRLPNLTNATVNGLTPSLGMIVSNTTLGFGYYDGASWLYYYSSSWTPTVTTVANVDAQTRRSTFFTRVGNFVIFHLSVSIDATAATTTTSVRYTLPIASAFVGSGDVSGSCSSTTGPGIAANFAVTPDVANAELLITGTTGSGTGNYPYYCTGMYIIR